MFSLNDLHKTELILAARGEKSVKCQLYSGQSVGVSAVRNDRNLNIPCLNFFPNNARSYLGVLKVSNKHVHLLLIR